MRAVPERCAERMGICELRIQYEECAESRRRFMSAVPEGYAEGGGDL